MKQYIRDAVSRLNAIPATDETFEDVFLIVSEMICTEREYRAARKKLKEAEGDWARSILRLTRELKIASAALCEAACHRGGMKPHTDECWRAKREAGIEDTNRG